MILLDTHVVAWLYAGDLERLPAPTRARLERSDLGVSPIVALELQYLHEIGRLREAPAPVLADLRRLLGLRVVDSTLADIVRAALAMGWTRDPFDRLICAHAETVGAPLVTADETIRRNLSIAVWGD